MAPEIIRQFQVVNVLQQEAILKLKEAFDLLKAENSEEEREQLKEVNEEIVLFSYDFTKQIDKLLDMVGKECEEKGVSKKFDALLTYFTVEEKEQFMEQLHLAIQYNRTYQNQAMMCRVLAESKYEATEAIVDLWRHIAQQESGNGRVMLNKKI